MNDSKVHLPRNMATERSTSQDEGCGDTVGYSTLGKSVDLSRMTFQVSKMALHIFPSIPIHIVIHAPFSIVNLFLSIPSHLFSLNLSQKLKLITGHYWNEPILYIYIGIHRILQIAHKLKCKFANYVNDFNRDSSTERIRFLILIWLMYYSKILSWWVLVKTILLQLYSMQFYAKSFNTYILILLYISMRRHSILVVFRWKVCFFDSHPPITFSAHSANILNIL